MGGLQSSARFEDVGSYTPERSPLKIYLLKLALSNVYLCDGILIDSGTIMDFRHIKNAVEDFQCEERLCLRAASWSVPGVRSYRGVHMTLLITIVLLCLIGSSRDPKWNLTIDGTCPYACSSGPPGRWGRPGNVKSLYSRFQNHYSVDYPCGKCFPGYAGIVKQSVQSLWGTLFLPRE